MNYSNIHSPRSHADERHRSSSATEKKKEASDWRRFPKKRQRTVREPDRPDRNPLSDSPSDSDDLHTCFGK